MAERLRRRPPTPARVRRRPPRGSRPARAALEVAAEDLAEQVAALAEQVGDAQRRLDAASEQRGLVAEQLAAQLSAVAERRAAVTNIDRERAGLLASIAGDERRAEGVREQLARIADRRRALTDHAFAHAAEREALADQIKLRKTDLVTIETDLAAHESSADQMSADRRDRAGALADLEQQGVRLESRRQTLQELIDARAGLGDAVREVLDRKERREGFERVVAPLADLIEADEAAAASVETALGATLQALVVETVGDLPSAEELDTLPGRVAFVPISRLGSTPRRQVLDTAGLFGQRVTPMRTLVRARTPLRAPSASSGSASNEGTKAPSASSGSESNAAAETPNLRSGSASNDGTESPSSRSGLVEAVNPERVEALLDRLLGETYLVPDLDAALLLASGPLAGRRMVTRQGCVLEPDGRIIAGPPGAADATGVLQQRGELTRLAAELADIHARLLVARDALARVDSQAAALNETMAALRHRQAAEQRHLAGESAKLDRLVAESDRLDREQASLAEDAEQTEQRLEKIDADREQLKARADRLERLHADEETRAMEAQRALERTQAERDAMAERSAPPASTSPATASRPPPHGATSTAPPSSATSSTASSVT